MCQDVQVCVKMCRDVQDMSGCVMLIKMYSTYIIICQDDESEWVKMCQDVSGCFGCVRMCQDVSGCIRVCQDTICQDMSGCK